VAISPTLAGGSGQPVPLIGIMNTADAMLLWAAMCLIVTGQSERKSVRNLLIASGLVCYGVLIFQSRTMYLQLVGMLILVVLFRRRAVGTMLAFVPVFVAVVTIMSALDVRLSGRLTDHISLSFFTDHVAAIFGRSTQDSQAIAAAASGVDERLAWWSDLFERLTADPLTFLTGLGYGFPLVPFRATGGIQVREPHNSVISVFSRVGFIGLSCWVWMQVELFRCWAKCFSDAAGRSLRAQLLQDRLLVLLTFLVIVLIGAVGEDNMEKPFFAIPYYFLWGVVLRLSFIRATKATAQIFLQPRASIPQPLRSLH
jgi:hypothetical protein